MLADDILAINFDDAMERKKIEVYGYGISVGRGNMINFEQLQKVLSKISANMEESDSLLAEFIKGYLDGLP